MVLRLGHVRSYKNGEVYAKNMIQENRFITMNEKKESNL